jgi:hypothetical protein
MRGATKQPQILALYEVVGVAFLVPGRWMGDVIWTDLPWQKRDESPFSESAGATGEDWAAFARFSGGARPMSWRQARSEAHRHSPASKRADRKAGGGAWEMQSVWKSNDGCQDQAQRMGLAPAGAGQMADAPFLSGGAPAGKRLWLVRHR